MCVRMHVGGSMCLLSTCSVIYLMLLVLGPNKVFLIPDSADDSRSISSSTKESTKLYGGGRRDQ